MTLSRPFENPKDEDSERFTTRQTIKQIFSCSPVGVIKDKLEFSRNVSEAGLFQEKTLMLGALSTLLSSTFWQISAIYLSLPVSGSHSIVSGLIGKICYIVIGRILNASQVTFNFLSALF